MESSGTELKLYSDISTAVNSSGSKCHVFALRTSLGAASLIATQKVDDKDHPYWEPGCTLPSARMGLRQLVPSLGKSSYLLGLGSNGRPYLVSASMDVDAARWMPGMETELPTNLPSGTVYTSLAAIVGTDASFQVLALDSQGYVSVAAYQRGDAPNYWSDWSAGSAINTTRSCSAFAVGNGWDANKAVNVHVVGLVGGKAYLLASQGPGPANNRFWLPVGTALTALDDKSFVSVQAVSAPDGLFFIGLTTEGYPAVIAWQDGAGTWRDPEQLSLETFASISAGADVSKRKLAVAGLTLADNSGPPPRPKGTAMLISTRLFGTKWIEQGKVLSPEHTFGAIAVGAGGGAPGEGPCALVVVGLDAKAGNPYLIARLDQELAPHKGRRFDDLPLPPPLVTVREGNFANPDHKDCVSANAVPGTLVFTDFGELGFLYPTSSPGEGEASMSLHYARTRNIALYAAGGVGLKGADVDISSGWSDNALLDLLVGGRANQNASALVAHAPPAVVKWNGFTFFFWASSDDNRIYAAYMNQDGIFSALIEVFANGDIEGNGTDPLEAPAARPSPAAYTYGDQIYLLVPSVGREAPSINIHVFHPKDIAYSAADRRKGVFVNYAGTPVDQKPGHTTWVRSEFMVVPLAVFYPTTGQDTGTNNPSVRHVSACLNVALGRQPYLVVSVGLSSQGTCSDRIITLDPRTGLPDDLTIGKRGVVLVDKAPPVHPGQAPSIITVPNANVRGVSRKDGSNKTIHVRYLDPSETLGNDKKVYFDKPTWQEEDADPSMDVPASAQPLANGVAQTVVYGPAYPDPDAAVDSDPKEVAKLLNVYTVFITSATPSPTTARAAKPNTIYLTRRLGTARQVPSTLVPRRSNNPRAGLLGDTPGTGLGVDAIMDGPLPVPCQNISQLTGGFIGSPIARLTLGSTDSESDSFSNEKYIANGVEAEGSLTLGFSWKWSTGFLGIAATRGSVSFSASLIGKLSYMIGATHGWTTLETQTAQSNFVVTGALVADPKDMQYAAVEQKACLFASSPSLRMVRFQFLNNKDVVVNPKFTPFSISLGASERKVQTIDPLSVKPGDLKSYRIDDINRSMEKAYDALSSEDKQHFRESDYRDYFHNVIEKNALVLGSGKAYLEFAWCNGGMFAETSDQLAQRTDSTGWDYSWETKAGVAVDFKIENEIDASAIPADSYAWGMSFEAKLQTLYAHKRTEKSARDATGTRSFGISGDLGIMRAGYLDGDVDHYSFRVYLLRPSQQWTLEANLMGKSPQPGLNLTSRPWKVMYVVNDDIGWVEMSHSGETPRLESREPEEELELAHS